ncbi:aminotransferase class III-fold pyridoxal phosphate-dependent enzyme, partial [Frankia sp. EI5c]|uniref:aminotransferase class III-fold pyridoxal phosphate-dependent enzyme n=1 Tax=Frankia sp. EI5c TaxID=683316 RepID=UPI001F5B59E7
MTTISPADIDAGPTSADPTAAAAILARQASRESAARTYARSLPIVPVSAAGSWMVGADGRRYLDFLAGAGTLATGHNHPVVVEAIQRVLRSGAPLHVLDIATPEKDAFSDELASTLPAGLREDPRLLFCGPTGADAVEAAFKLAQTVTGRQTVLAFTGAYHGMTAGALAATGRVDVKEPLPAPGGVIRLPFPYSYRCPFGVGGAAGAEISARYVERLLDDPCGGVTSPAAMILEVVQGEGGVIPAPDDWLRAMRELTTRRGIPLIVDEVQT